MMTDGHNSFAVYNYIWMEWPNDEFNSSFEAGFKTNSSSLSTMKKYDFENNQVENLVNNSNFRKPGRWLVTFNNLECFSSTRILFIFDKNKN